MQKIFNRAFIVILSLVIYAGCNTDSTIDDHTGWTQYGGGPDQSKFFNASVITKENVGRLEMKWVYASGDDVFNFFSPAIVDTIMYVVGKNSSLIALNAITGKEIWIHANLKGLTRRGINYWESKDKKDKRLIFTLNNTLQAIDAVTGKSVMSFGNDGSVDLREGLDRDPSSIRRIQSMMPGVIYQDLVILGSAPGEGYFSPPGYVRAYHVVTGKLTWTFHTIPHPGEFGYDTWPKDAYKYVGGVNVWSEISIDQKRGIAFLPIGSPTFDFYGGDRIGSNLFGNSLVALDARTGKRLWHFQTVHHDLWDYDLSPAPQLLTVQHKGKRIDAVAVATKHGFVFVFDRVTGKPLFSIDEKPVPPSEMPGEEAWPTQPISSLPSYTRHEVTRETMNPYFPDDIKQKWHARLDAAKSGLFVPPSDKYETIIMPGALGGANYGNTAADPKKGILYILTQECTSTYRLSKVEPPKIDLSNNQIAQIKSVYGATCQTCHGPNMEGGAGPALVNAGQYIFYNEFKEVITFGRGQMPGFAHVDEETIKALYLFLGGNARSFNFPGVPNKETTPEGPVVASGGAPIKANTQKGPPMTDYPKGVAHPDVRYITGYDVEWTGLLTPPWSSILAYDLNAGTIKWRKPVGQDSVYAQGDPTKGAPEGVLRKGMIITSTGIVFATAKGGKVYAFNADNGDILWETTLSHETNAQPSIFRLNGKEYLVINAASDFRGGSYDHSKKPGALPKGYVVFGLPD